MAILPEYLERIQEHVKRETTALAGGGAKTYEDYARRVGIIKGLELAMSELTELVTSKPGEERV